MMFEKPARLSMRSVIVRPACARSPSRCQSVSGVENINMEKDVGSLQDEALKRKERLKALREKQRHVSAGDLFCCGFAQSQLTFLEGVVCLSRPSMWLILA